MSERIRPNEKSRYSGIELLTRSAEGVEQYKLTAGSYAMDIGFREIGVHESDWFSAASDDESHRAVPFQFDYNHPSVVAFNATLLSGIPTTLAPTDFERLCDRFNASIRSLGLSEPEFNTRLSDVVNSKSGTCEAKSLLFGSLLKKYTQISIQAIVGRYGRVYERVDAEYSHQWIRIEQGNHLYLFDPMYNKTACFEHTPEGYEASDNGYVHFANLTPAAYPAGRIITEYGNLEGWEGVRAVESADGEVLEFYVEDADTLKTQCANAISLRFTLRDKEVLELHSGSIRTGTPGTGLYFPVQSLIKE